MIYRMFPLCLAAALLSLGVAAGSEEDALKSELSRLNYRIFFETYQQDNWEIHSIRPDGADRKNLTRTKNLHELYPQASPDGRHISFIQDEIRDGKIVRSVCVMDADGQNRKVVCENVRQPVWSPDGKRIAFVRMEFDKFNLNDYASKGLYFYELDTGKTTKHPNEKIEHLYCLSWPSGQNGKWLFSTVHAGMGFQHAIIAIELDGPRIAEVWGNGCCRPCVSSDGKHMIWCWGDARIGLTDLVYGPNGPTTSNDRDVYRIDKSAGHLYHSDFSPDGKYVAFSVGKGGRMAANGPGTHVGISELVGVRGSWDVWVRRTDRTGPAIRLTVDGESCSNKEPEWTVVPANGK